MSIEESNPLLGEDHIGNHGPVFDVVVIGAGISGINAAYRVQSELPDASYTVIEARGDLGGTWDFFRYPGLRSDSDLTTFGFPWRPWSDEKVIAEADAIRKYLHESAAEFGIDKKIQYHHKLVGGDWSSDDQTWTLIVEVGDPSEGETPVRKFLSARFIILSTGYYDYERALSTDIPNISNFEGQIIHPQFWPEDLDYTNKRVVVVGSGATAVTLVPVLAEKASHVAMLQRSPGFILNRPSKDWMAKYAFKYLPYWVAHNLIRIKYLTIPFLFFKFCQAYPRIARRAIKRRTLRELPPNLAHDPNFEPKYNPWEQRLCICPDGDFWLSLRSGKASVATGTIQTVTKDSIVYTPTSPKLTKDAEKKEANGHAMEAARSLPADIIVTATGLRFLIAGGASFTVNSTPIEIPSCYLWKGLMLSGVPNAATVIGYTNASWTLGADATARHACRLIKHMRKKGLGAIVPRISEEEKQTMKPMNVVNLNSTYVERARGDMPRAGDKGPWRPRKNYFADLWEARFGRLMKGLEAVPKK